MELKQKKSLSKLLNSSFKKKQTNKKTPKTIKLAQSASDSKQKIYYDQLLYFFFYCY